MAIFDKIKNSKAFKTFQNIRKVKRDIQRAPIEGIKEAVKRRKEIGNSLLDLTVRGPARLGKGIQVSYEKLLDKTSPDVYTPKTGVDKFLYGNENVLPIGKEIAGSTEKGSRFLNEKVGIPEFASTPLAFLGSVGLKGLESIPETGSVGKAAGAAGKALSKIDDVTDIARVAEKVPDDMSILKKVVDDVNINNSDNFTQKIIEEASQSNLGFVPKIEKTDKGVSSIYKNLIGRGQINEAEDVGSNMFYDRMNMKEVQDNASRMLRENPDEAMKFATNVPVGQAATAEQVVVQSKILENMLETGKDVRGFLDNIAEQAKIGGQGINAYKTFYKSDPIGNVILVDKAFQKLGKVADPEILDDVYKNMTRINKIEDPAERLVESGKYMKELQKKIPSGTWDIAMGEWKSNMLTSMATFGTNIAGTGLGTISKLIGDIPTSIIDRTRSFITKTPRTKIFTTRGFGEGFTKGLKSAKQIMQHGMTQDDKLIPTLLNKTRYPNTLLGRALQKKTDFVFDLLNASDQLFYEAHKVNSLYSQALLDIKNTGKKFDNAADREKYIREFVSNPSIETLQNADEDALIGVFRNNTDLNKMLEAAKNSSESIRRPMDILMPFQKTPTAWAVYMTKYTPIGTVQALTNFAKIISGKGVPMNSKRFMELLGKQAVGYTAFAWAGRSLYKNGDINLSYPKNNPKEAARWEQEGRQPMTVRIGDRYIPLVVFGPIAGGIVAGAAYEKAISETGSPSAAAKESIVNSMKMFSEQPMVQGMSNAMSIFSGDEKVLTQYINNLAGSIVPSLVNSIAKATDQKRRQIDSTVDAVKARIPGLSETLQEKTGVFGKDLEQSRSPFNYVVSPIRAYKATDNKAYSELQRLKDNGEDIMPTKIDRTVYGMKLDAETYKKYNSIIGKSYESTILKAMNHPKYKAMTPEKQADYLSGIKKKINAEARSKVLMPALYKDLGLKGKIGTDGLHKLLTELNKNPKYKSSLEKDKIKMIKSLVDSGKYKQFIKK